MEESEELFPANPEQAEAVAEEEVAAPEAEGKSKEKLTRFPVARVKTIMKLDPDVALASQEATFLIAKALELFVESLAREAYQYTAHSKKKTMARTDVDKAIDAADCLAFLEGAIDD